MKTPPAPSLSLDDFLAPLPAERQAPLRELWQLVRQAVPSGYTEHIGPRFLEFRIGTEMCLALANQKNYMSLYLMPLYVMPGLREQLATAAPALKTGKSCLNFKRLEELPLAALARIIAATPAEAYLAQVRAGHGK